VTAAQPRAAGMIDARRRDSDVKRARVHTALDQMLQENEPISFAAVARVAHVSTWLVYAPGIRESVEQARAQQQRPRQNDGESPTATSDRGLQTELALARAEIARLRAERDQQQRQLRRALGARLDDLAKADLVSRVDELTRHNSEQAAALTRQQADNQTLKARVTELEDDLAAARTSLRRMIHDQNLAPQ